MMIDKQIEAAKCEMIDYVDEVVKLHERLEHATKGLPISILADLQETMNLLGVSMTRPQMTPHEVFQEVIIPALKEVDALLVDIKKRLDQRITGSQTNPASS